MHRKTCRELIYKQGQQSTGTQALTWSISINLGKAPGHSIATFTISAGGGIVTLLRNQYNWTLNTAESLSYSHLQGERKKKKRKEYYRSSGRTPALPLRSPTLPPAGQVDESVCVYLHAGAGDWHMLQEQTQHTILRHIAQLNSLLERWLKHWNVQWITGIH